MPHILARLNASDPAVLSLEAGAWSTRPLGFEVDTFTSRPDQQMQDFKSALNRLVASTDPDVAAVRDRVNDTYRNDTAGAPEDFAFACGPDQNILDTLAAGDDDTLRTFAAWNRQRMAAQREAMTAAMPALGEDAELRAICLGNLGLISPDAIRSFSRVFDRVDRIKRYHPLDSFEAGVSVGLSTQYDMYITHQFADGYAFGQPTQEYFKVGFHELGHLVCRDATWTRPFKYLPMVEEVMLSHYTSVSDENGTDHILDICEATQPADYYRPERRLFGVVMREQQQPDLVVMSAGRALMMPAGSQEEAVVVLALFKGFHTLFPEHGEAALVNFVKEYTHAPPLGRSRVAQAWAATAYQRQTGTAMPA